MTTTTQKTTLAWRRLQRAVAVAIYPPFSATALDELDVEFQKGLEAGMEAEGCAQDLRDVRAGRRLVFRRVMGQDDDGTPNGEDYTEQRYITDWRTL